jgi:hypothetical protein
MKNDASDVILAQVVLDLLVRDYYVQYTDA